MKIHISIHLLNLVKKKASQEHFREQSFLMFPYALRYLRITANSLKRQHARAGQPIDLDGLFL
jgi:hypothetical protein